MQGGYAQPAPARAGGGFMAQAMTTAAGVAGGMLAANAISNMMGGHHGHGSSGSVASVDQSGADAAQDAREDQQLAQDSQQDGQQDQQQYASDESNDPGVSDTADSGWGGGSDSSDA